MSKEIIELVEEAIIHAAMIQSNCRKPDLVIKRAEILAGSCGKHGILHQALTLLKRQPTEVHKALEPIAEWYGGGTEGNRSDIEIITDVVADLQKDRAELLLLKQPKCKTCGDNKKILSPDSASYVIGSQQAYIPCPDCQQLLNTPEEAIDKLFPCSEQPPTSETTEMIRLNLDNWEESLFKTKDIRVVQIIKWLKAVCDRLDKAEARSIDCPNRPASKTEVEMAKRLCNYQDEVHELKQQIDRVEAISKIQDERITNFEAIIKIKDELIFAYESVNAPINPLLSVNRDLLKACEIGLKSMKGLLEIGVEIGADNESKRIYTKDIRQVAAAIAKAKE